MAETRWLAWCGGVTSHRKQYFALKTHFNMISNDPKKTCPAAKLLAELHNDDANLLYLTFLEPVLKQVAAVNLIFQSTYADITAAYGDLRTLVLSIGERIIKPEILKKSSQAGMIRLDELEAFKAAVYKENNWKPLDTVNFGESFRQLAENLLRDQKLTKEKITEVKVTCGKFLVRLCRELVDRLPNCVAELEKLRFFAPNRVLSKTARPAFSSLPFQSSRFDLEILETQWSTLGALRFEDICDDEPSLDSVDIVKFWVCVGEVKNAIGKKPLKELSDAVLSLLTLPLSNAFVERVLSVMGVVKNKLRNRMSLEMLNSILFLRLYLQAFGKCCRDFQPTEDMLRNFNSHTMYPSKKGKTESRAETSVPTQIDQDEAAAGDNGEEDNDEDETTVDIPDDPEAIDILVSLLDEGRDVAEIIAAISSA